MTDQPVHDITSVQPQPVVIPPKPSPTLELEREAENCIRYLDRLATSNVLDTELRMAMNDIKNVMKSLKQTVARQSSEAQDNHDKLVEIVRSQRLM